MLYESTDGQAVSRYWLHRQHAHVVDAYREDGESIRIYDQGDQLYRGPVEANTYDRVFEPVRRIA